MAKYWGEEKCDGAIYSIYLRKVRYLSESPSTAFGYLAKTDDVSPVSRVNNNNLQWETVREKVIKAGTLQRLVENLIASDEKMDSRHFNVFFATYRTFASPQQILPIFIRLYNTQKLDKISSNGCIQVAANSGQHMQPTHENGNSKTVMQNTICAILICWLDMYPEDFCQEEKQVDEGKSQDFLALDELIDFAKVNFHRELKHRARRLRERLKRFMQEGGLASQIPSIGKFSFAVTAYDPISAVKAGDELAFLSMKERAQMFDISLDNCTQIAEQLTFWDALYFRELRPYQCLGGIWGKRNKNHSDKVYSVRATIDQFNAVCQRVMTSVVFPENCKPEFRARIIEKWIVIAQELRALKNFSSLKAVISSLQSEPVYRLKSVWAALSKSTLAIFEELSAIFDVNDDGDVWRAREILEAEGTAKSSSVIKENKCRRTKSDMNLYAESAGTVPYLGTFLTDLAMLDQAHVDNTPEGLINFEKRRREFEVLAKIRLFQSAARAYTIPMDQAFCVWFHYLPSLNEKECFDWSLKAEPPTTTTPKPKRWENRNFSSYCGDLNSPKEFFNSTRQSFDTRRRGIFDEISAGNSKFYGFSNGHQNTKTNAFDNEKNARKLKEADQTDCLSFEKERFTKLGESFSSQSRISDKESYCESPMGLFDSTSKRFPRLTASATAPTNHKNASKADDLQQTPTSRWKPKFLQASQKSISSASSHSSSVSTGGASLVTPTSYNNSIETYSISDRNFHLIRVGLDDSLQDNPGTTSINYKCIKIVNGDRTPSIIERALQKHTIDTDKSDKYLLVQLLPDGSEMRLPEDCNPFYAVAPDPCSPMLNFLLKKKNPDNDTSLPLNAMRKQNRQKRSNLLRWNSGYL